jgi:hypothetical protein
VLFLFGWYLPISWRQLEYLNCGLFLITNFPEKIILFSVTSHRHLEGHLILFKIMSFVCFHTSGLRGSEAEPSDCTAWTGMVYVMSIREVCWFYIQQTND